MIKKIPSVAIIIINYNGERVKVNNRSILDQCLNSLSKANYPNFKIIVVDNGSEDNSKRITNKYGADFIHIPKSPYNYNYSIPSNAGIKHAIDKYGSDYFILMNDDVCAINTSWLSDFVNSAEKTNAGIIGCKLVDLKKRIQHAGFDFQVMPVSRGLYEPDVGQYSETKEIYAVVGACMMISNSVFKSIGKLDEKLVMGFEDVDYCVRAREAGFKVFYSGDVKLSHIGSLTETKILTSQKLQKIKFYYGIRNIVYFMKKHKNLFNQIHRAKGLLHMIIASFFSKANANGKRSLLNLHLTKPISNVFIIPDAIRDGNSLGRGSEIMPPKYRPYT